jgi:hypothetical protein
MTLPNFLVIGASKCGTSSLRDYLDQHPDVFMSTIKEPSFFGYRGARTRRFKVTSLEEYEALFAAAGRASAIGDSSPYYMSSELAADDIRRHLPGVKLIAILRDPVERALSDYMMQVRKGRVSRLDRDPSAGYLQAGFYHQRLERYFTRFPRERIKVLFFEDFTADPAATMREIYAFVGVDPEFRPKLGVLNEGSFPKRLWLNRILTSEPLTRLKRVVPGSLRAIGSSFRRWNLGARPSFGADDRRWLRDLYREDVRKLQALLGRDLSRWSAAS